MEAKRLAACLALTYTLPCKSLVDGGKGAGFNYTILPGSDSLDRNGKVFEGLLYLG